MSSTKNRFFRDSVALSLIVYCTSFLIFYQCRLGGSIIEDFESILEENTNGLYLAGTILINFGAVMLVLYDLIDGSSNQIVNIVCSSLEIIGAVCYFIAFIVDTQNISGYTMAYYIGCLIFVCCKALILASLTLSNDASPKSKVMTKCVVSVASGACMLYYWFNDYNSVFSNKPTETQYALIMSGWSVVIVSCIAIIVYEANKSSNKATAISLGVILSIGSVLLLVGSVLYNANVDILQISSEWALSFSVFIASVTTAISLANNARLRQEFDQKADKLLNRRMSVHV